MTIHSEHPFLPPEGERSPLRRLRGRMAAPVTVWAAGEGRPSGWTVSSMMLADGDPAEVVGLVDEDSDFADVVARTRVFTVNLLDWSRRNLGDAFAGTAPAPGGPFTLAQWDDTAWGPALVGGPGWIGARLLDGDPVHAGWGQLVRAVIEHVEIDDAGDPGALVHVRGRYRRLDQV